MSIRLQFALGHARIRGQIHRGGSGRRYKTPRNVNPSSEWAAINVNPSLSHMSIRLGCICQSVLTSLWVARGHGPKSTAVGTRPNRPRWILRRIHARLNRREDGLTLTKRMGVKTDWHRQNKTEDRSALWIWRIGIKNITIGIKRQPNKNDTSFGEDGLRLYKQSVLPVRRIGIIQSLNVLETDRH